MTLSNANNALSFNTVPADGTGIRHVAIHPENIYLPSKGTPRNKSPLVIIGFDTEYQTDETREQKSTLVTGSKNHILSYQFCVRIVFPDLNITCPGTSTGIVIPGPDENDRLSLEEFVRIAIGSFISDHPGVKIPTDVYLVGHFTRADLPAFSDFKNKAQTLMANVRNSFLTLQCAIPVSVADTNGEFAAFKVEIRDTMALAPANAKSLADIGNIVGLEKIQLSPDADEEIRIKSNMAELRERDWPLFRFYAIRDAEVCVEYAERILRQYYSLFGVFIIPATLTGFGTRLVINTWHGNGFPENTILGKEDVTEHVYSHKKGYFRKKKTSQYIEEIYYDIPFVSETFHGGRNEQYIFGMADEGDWRDLDLTSAYPTAMTLIGLPSWNEARQIDDNEQIEALDLAFFSVDFEFPEHVRFPTLPVRTSNGIIFPRIGNSKCAAPELELAKRLGATVNVKRGIIVPTDPTNSVFSDFIRMTVERRNQYPKGTFDNLFWKEVGNSTYGKTAQGLRRKRVYDLRSDDAVELPQSEITQPFFAAFITSYVRAVLGEALNAFSPSVQVFSVTTDGFLTNANDTEVARAQSGPLFHTFADARRRLVGSDNSIEVKHRIRQPIGWRTRGSATLQPGEGSDGIVLQKGGIKISGDRSLTAENRHMVDLFINRHPNSTVSYKTGAGIRDLMRLDVDFVFRTVEKSLSMEYDWKRRPINVRDVEFTFEGRRYQHLTFDTEPLTDINEFNRIRDGWETYSKNPKRNLKSVADYQAFQCYLHTNIDNAKVVTRYLRRVDGDISRLRQDLCSGFKKLQGGFDTETAKRRITHQDFSNALESCGIPCKTSDVENGRKRDFRPNNSIPTPRVIEALYRLKDEFFPHLEIEKFLSEGSSENRLQSDHNKAA